MIDSQVFYAKRSSVSKSSVDGEGGRRDTFNSVSSVDGKGGRRDSFISVSSVYGKGGRRDTFFRLIFSTSQWFVSGRHPLSCGRIIKRRRIVYHHHPPATFTFNLKVKLLILSIHLERKRIIKTCWIPPSEFLQRIDAYP